jgi:hypothetical protein
VNVGPNTVGANRSGGLHLLFKRAHATGAGKFDSTLRIRKQACPKKK